MQVVCQPTDPPLPLASHAYPSADTNPVLVYLASLSPGSRPTVLGTLQKIAGMIAPTVSPAAFPWHRLRYQHVQAVRSQLMGEASPATTNKALAFLRNVLKECWRLGYMTTDEYQRTVDVSNVPGSSLPQSEKGRHLTAGELRSLFMACDDGTRAGARDGAILAVAYSAGLRRSEIAWLQVGDYDPDNCEIVIRSGKRNKSRMIAIAESACAWLDRWLLIRGGDAGCIFCHIRRGDHLTADGITDHGVYMVLKRRGEQAGVKAFTPHDLRRSFIGDLLDAGVDIATIQQMAGHASPMTTSGYDRRGKRAKHDAARRLHVPGPD